MAADWFSGVVPASFALRVGLSLGLFAFVVGMGYLVRLLRGQFGSNRWNRVVDVGLAVGLVGIAAAVGWGLLSIWEVSTLAVFESPQQAVDILTRATVTAVIAIGTYLLTGAIKRFVYEFTHDRSGITQHQTELLFRTTQVSLYVLAGVLVFGVWELNLGGLLVGAGFLGIVVGLAARQTLGSLIAGFVLMVSRPFEIGDWIAIGDREGIVTEISIVNTRIQTFDGEYAMVPNDVVASNEVINRTRKGRLRIGVDVGVDYRTDLDRAIAIAKEAMGEVEEVLTVPQPQVFCQEFGDSSIVLRLLFWIDRPSARRRWRARTGVIQGVKAAFDREGIKIPFPQRELSSRPEDGAWPADTEPAEGTTPEPTADGDGR